MKQYIFIKAAVAGVLATVVGYRIVRRQKINDGVSKDNIAKPSENVKVSVITVCYNSEDSIDKTIESVLSQTYSNIEYLIIDGGSTDSTVDRVRSYVGEFADRGWNLNVVSEADQGIYDAMNKGIEKTSGILVGFINAGDWYEIDAIETAVYEYEKEPYDYFYADINLVKDDGTVIVKHSKSDVLVTSRHWNHPSSFVAKSLYDRIGRFRNHGIHDDFEFFLRARKSKAKMRIINKVIANFRTGGVSNQKSIGKAIERIKDRYSCYKDNGYSSIYLVECVVIEIAKAIIS